MNDEKKGRVGRPKRETTAISGTFADILSDLIEERRKATGQSQNKMAEDLGVTSGTLSQWASDSKTPKDIETYVKIADYFGVSLDYLIGRSKIRKDKINGVLAVDLGLSDLAITNLLELNEWQNKYCERFVSTINFLLEQETKPPTSAGFVDDYGNFVDSFDSEYSSWEAKGYIPLLTVIDEFLAVEEDNTAVYDIMESGKILDVPERGRFNIGSVKTVKASAIIERVLLDDIEDKLKRLRLKHKAQK